MRSLMVTTGRFDHARLYAIGHARPPRSVLRCRSGSGGPQPSPPEDCREICPSTSVTTADVMPLAPRADRRRRNACRGAGCATDRSSRIRRRCCAPACRRSRAVQAVQPHARMALLDLGDHALKALGVVGLAVEGDLDPVAQARFGDGQLDQRLARLGRQELPAGREVVDVDDRPCRCSRRSGSRPPAAPTRISPLRNASACSRGMSVGWMMTLVEAALLDRAPHDRRDGCCGTD